MGIKKWFMEKQHPLLTVSTETNAVQQLEIIKAFSYPCNCGYSLIYPIPEVDQPAVIKCDQCFAAYSMTWKGDHFLSRPLSDKAIPDTSWLRFKEKYAEQLKPKTEAEVRATGIDGAGFVELGSNFASVINGGFGKPPEL